MESPQSRNREETHPLNAKVRRRLFWSLVVVVLGLAVFLGIDPYLALRSPLKTGEIPMTISMSGWSTDVVYARAGDQVTIVLTNLDTRFHADGLGKHNFVLEEFGINALAQPGETIRISFTPNRKGEFDFYCDVCCGGMNNPFMHGTLVVN